MSRQLDHFFVSDHAVDRPFRGRSAGRAKIRKVHRQSHGQQLIQQINNAFTESDSQKEDCVVPPELKSLGTVIVLAGAESQFALKKDSLEQYTKHQKTTKKPKWLLLSVRHATDTEPERATVWVSDEFRGDFLDLFEKYLHEETKTGTPKNNALVANIAHIKRAVAEDLWTSEKPFPCKGKHWWELWLEINDEQLADLKKIALCQSIKFLDRSFHLRDRTVIWVESSLQDLEILLFGRAIITEIREPQFVDSIEDLSIEEQQEFVLELAQRIVAAPEDAPAVCLLDTGVYRPHVLLRLSVLEEDQHTAVGVSGVDEIGHGTAMAGIALLGNLDPHLTGTAEINLRHRLESVKMLPGQKEKQLIRREYGTVTAYAVSLAEISNPRDRVFCLTLSAQPDGSPGKPTLWSATLDALAVGVDVVEDGNKLQLLSEPDPDFARLFIVAAGNIQHYTCEFRTESKTSIIQDPAQSWNSLTVGAFTDLVNLPQDPQYLGWKTLAQAGELSPHSCTSVLFEQKHTSIKPDICMEGGNVITDGELFEDKHPLLTLRSTGSTNDLALTSANATSAATAQAARLAALVMERYPTFWPETVRGLLTHSAEWTSKMWEEVKEAKGKHERLMLLRQFGWGIPNENAVLNSSNRSVTIVSQDQFVPYEGPEHKLVRFRLHELPWPSEALEQLGSTEVRMRITLSYFIEPTASRRGWEKKYSYASHLLRFDVQGPQESHHEFVCRISQMSEDDEKQSPNKGEKPDSARWLIGEKQRNNGSLHQDDWVGTGSDLAQCNAIAVYPVGGWWKNNQRASRIDLPVRYSLIVSLQTPEQDIDLYTPIETQLNLPIHVDIEI